MVGNRLLLEALLTMCACKIFDKFQTKWFGRENDSCIILTFYMQVSRLLYGEWRVRDWQMRARGKKV